MSHQIDRSTGKSAFVEIKTNAPAWHGLINKTFSEHFTAEEALNEAQANFTVIKIPNIHSYPDPTDPTGERFIEVISDESFFTFRTDVNKILGTRLGKDYQVLQNREAFNFVDEILQSGRATIETAGVLNEGRRTFICLRLDKSLFVGNDEVKQYCVVVTSHDGSLSTQVFFTNVRVVCANTLAAALGEATGTIKVRHTKNQADRLTEAGKVLKLIARNTDINAANYSKMKETIISKQDFVNYIGNIFYSPDEIKKLQAGASPTDINVISTRKQNILDEVMRYANKGLGQAEALNNGQLNYWYAYNSVTGFYTARKYENANVRANSLLFGSAAADIQEAGVLALAPEKIKPLNKIINQSGFNYN